MQKKTILSSYINVTSNGLYLLKSFEENLFQRPDCLSRLFKTNQIAESGNYVNMQKYSMENLEEAWRQCLIKMSHYRFLMLDYLCDQLHHISMKLESKRSAFIYLFENLDR